MGVLLFLRGPRTGSWREGSGKQRSSSDRFCELRDMVSSPHACETEGEDLTPLVPRPFEHGYAIVSQPSHHPTRASNNGRRLRGKAAVAASAMQEIEPSKDKNG